MGSTVTTRPSHYEVLGLSPAAAADEIARAFAREMSRPRAFGAIAEVSIAYETLRDPARRRAYDESLGLKRAPKPAPVLSSAGVGAAAFLARPALVAEPAPAATAPPRPERPDIAAALRQLARPEPLHDPAPPPRPVPAPPPPAAERIHLAIADADADPAGAIPWKPVAIAAGGVALAVAVLGAWAGWDSGAGAQEAKAAAKVALPPPTTFTVDDPAAARALGNAAPPEPKRTARAAPRLARTRPAPRPAPAERAPSPPADPLAPIVAAAEPAADPGPAPAAVAAHLPLPDAVIARTIGRIGYPCGAVAATSAAGAPGVFTVTCTSGHSYRAAPVHGRYRFRRVAG
jgi:hypothetical protein